MFYKNISHSIKTFYGVTFKPGEIKEVPGYINSPRMIAVSADKLKPVSRQSNSSLRKQEKSSEKIASVTPEVKAEEKLEDKSNDSKSSSSKE